MAFFKHAALAAKHEFANGYAKSVLFHLLNTAQESWLCRTSPTYPHASLLRNKVLLFMISGIIQAPITKWDV